MSEPEKPEPEKPSLDERRAAKVKELKEHLASLTRTRAGFTVIAVALLLISPIGLMADGLITFAIATIAVCMLCVSAYLSFIYIRDTRDKITRLEPKSRTPKAS
jgi:hypothetical protein